MRHSLGQARQSVSDFTASASVLGTRRRDYSCSCAHSDSEPALKKVYRSERYRQPTYLGCTSSRNNHRHSLQRVRSLTKSVLAPPIIKPRQCPMVALILLAG